MTSEPHQTDWHTATNPDVLLGMVWPEFRALYWLSAVALRGMPPTTARRLRLFAVACARTVWDVLPTDARSAVLVAERYADGRATEPDLRAAAVPLPLAAVTFLQHALAAAGYASAVALGSYANDPELRWHPVEAARGAAKAVATRAAGPAPPGRPAPDAWHAAWTHAYNEARAAQADLFRDVFPPPGYTRVIAPDWLTPTVVALARQMDESGDFSAVPILADALQDAGCDDELLLGHCRAPGKPHVRGNWVVDAVLGR